jgi:Retrotransposon gag protein/Zinc knuckle
MSSLPIDWDTFPHLSRAQRAAVMRMADALGDAVALELVQAPPETHIRRIDAFIAFEESTRTAAAQAEEAAHARYADLEQYARSAIASAVVGAMEARVDKQHAAPRSPTKHRRKPVKLDVPKYRGTEDENLNHWLLSVGTACTAQLIEDDDLMVAFAMSHLAGRAKDWSFSKLMEDEAVFSTWETFVSQLRAAFQPANAQLQFKARLLHCRQGNRSLHEYVQELRYLNAAVSSDPLSEATKVTIFLEGLQQGPARSQLYRQIPDTLDEAFNVALMEEHAARSARGLPSIAPTRVATDGPVPMELSNAETGQQLRCFSCGRIGHIARDCHRGKHLNIHVKSRGSASYRGRANRNNHGANRGRNARGFHHRSRQENVTPQ